MYDDANLAQLMLTYRYPGSQRWLRPAYDGHCLTNLMQSLLAHFGLPHAAPLAFHQDFSRALQGKGKVVMLLLDGFGWLNWQRAVQRRPRLTEVLAPTACWPLTSVFPSTTSAALATLASGLPPAAHGVLGYLMYFPEYQRVFNMLGFRTPDASHESLLECGFDPAHYLPAPTVLQALRQAGVMAGAYSFHLYASSGLSQVLYPEEPAYPYLATGDLLESTLAQLHAPGPTFLFLYRSELDSIAHNHGADTEAYATQLQAFATTLHEQLLPRLDAETVLLITADHGHIDGNDDEAINLSAMPEVERHFSVVPAGEGRAAQLYLEPGSEAGVRRNLEDTGLFTVLDHAEMLPLFGEPRRSGMEAHLGDLLAMPHGSRRIIYDYQPAKFHTAMAGRHGGLSPEEMLVPLMAFTR